MLTPDEDARRVWKRWVVNSSFLKLRSFNLSNQSSVKICAILYYMITPDEDTRLECGN